MALFKGLGAFAGTFVVLGGATLAISTVAMGGVRAAVKYRRRGLEVTCTVCGGRKRCSCCVCKERLVLDWTPFKAPQVKRWTACPLCEASGLQTCLNCLGQGVVVPL
ncbi:hypothetical protein WJX81_008158 [Elliptochloris bilobata]|uniref:Uncharacterized protein n=1 Tax=Elliptochloris bilobata TaxID=381761 RepID=A0AAW1RS85_9CHLO